MQELIAQTFALRGAFDKTSDVDEFHCGRHDAIGVVDLSQTIHARIRHGNDTDVRFDGREWVVRRKASLVGKCGEQC